MALESFVSDYIKTTGLQVAVKTNLGPEVVLFNGDAPSKRSMLADLLQVGVVVRDRRGKIIAQHGGYPKTNPLIAGGLLLAIAGLVFVIGRGLVGKAR